MYMFKLLQKMRISQTEEVQEKIKYRKINTTQIEPFFFAFIDACCVRTNVQFMDLVCVYIFQFFRIFMRINRRYDLNNRSNK